MARFRSTKRAKELQRKAKHEAKEARKKERQEKPAGEDDDIDWSQAVGIDPPPGTVPAADADDVDDVDDDGGGETTEDEGR